MNVEAFVKEQVSHWSDASSGFSQPHDSVWRK